jgi:hypothetical protein
MILTSAWKLGNHARKGLTWAYIVVTPKHIGQVPGSVLYHDFIAGLFEAMEMDCLDIVGEGLGGKAGCVGWVFGMEMESWVE